MRSLLALALVSMSCVPAPVAAASPTPSAPARLVPRTNIEGPTFAFDFPGVRVGVAEYDEGPTGTTAFLFPPGPTGAVDARGGAPGTVMTDMSVGPRRVAEFLYDAPNENAQADAWGAVRDFLDALPE